MEMNNCRMAVGSPMCSCLGWLSKHIHIIASFLGRVHINDNNLPTTTLNSRVVAHQRYLREPSRLLGNRSDAMFHLGGGPSG